MQPQEIAQVAASIGGATAKEEVVVIGELQDVATSEHTFKMKLQDRIISGQFNDAINASHPALLPKTYQATLNVLQKVVVEDGREEITYFLVKLETRPKNSRCSCQSCLKNKANQSALPATVPSARARVGWVEPQRDARRNAPKRWVSQSRSRFFCALKGCSNEQARPAREPEIPRPFPPAPKRWELGTLAP